MKSSHQHDSHSPRYGHIPRGTCRNREGHQCILFVWLALEIMFKGSGAAVQKACGRSKTASSVQRGHTESTENLIAMRIVRIERIFSCPAEMAEIAEILFALNVFLSH